MTLLTFALLGLTACVLASALTPCAHPEHEHEEPVCPPCCYTDTGWCACACHDP